MKKVIFAAVLLLIFSGCVDKKSVLSINNLGICSVPSTKLYVNDVVVENSSQTFNISSDEIRISLVNALNETNCFVVSTSQMSKNSLTSKDEYLLDAKVNLSQDKDVVEENIFKKTETERLVMMISLSANNNGNKVLANSKSELVIDRSKYLGFKPESDRAGDNRSILKNATKKVSIALSDGFSKLK